MIKDDERRLVRQLKTLSDKRLQIEKNENLIKERLIANGFMNIIRKELSYVARKNIKNDNTVEKYMKREYLPILKKVKEPKININWDDYPLENDGYYYFDFYVALTYKYDGNFKMEYYPKNNDSMSEFDKLLNLALEHNEQGDNLQDYFVSCQNTEDILALYMF